MENNTLNSPDNILSIGQNKDTQNHSDTQIKPVFNDLINPDTIQDHIKELKKADDKTPHEEIINKLLEQVEPLDYEVLAFPQIKKLREQLEQQTTGSDQAKSIEKQINSFKLQTKHFLVLSVENIIKLAKNNGWGLCKNHDFIYIFNGAYWNEIEKEVFQKFLGEAAEKMGVKKFDARHYQFREQLYKQFLATAYLPTPESSNNTVLINLMNGTQEISPQGTKLRPFDRSDFITYQLPFEYNPEAKALIFERFLNRVLPDEQSRKVLAEYLGFVFIKHGNSYIKEEKALILYGTGANGKSVFFEVINALLGNDNVSSYSLQSLTNENGYYRAKLANKLVNYASEINGKLETSLFKALVSGEPVEARLPYGEPFTLRQYAKMIFNSNELPKDVEHTNAYFRRFLIIPFDVTIPEQEQDKNLHTKIIENELSGVFNWVLEGLNRLLKQKHFSECEAASRAVSQYRTESNSVLMFLEENGYKSHPSNYKLIQTLYPEYRAFCHDDGMIPLKKTNFNKQLRALKIIVDRGTGNQLVAYLEGGKIPF